MNSELIYKGISKTYDLLDKTYFKSKENNPRRSMLTFLDENDCKILDVCTGTATNAIYIANRFKDANVVGIDRSKEMLAMAEDKIANSQINTIRLYEMDATRTKFENQSFHAIIISLVLHEVPKRVVEEILDEAKRLLIPGGKLLVLEWEQPKSFVKKIQFYPIKMMEPKGFNDFLVTDKVDYFKEFGWTVCDVKHCDFSQVILLKADFIKDK